MAERPSLAVPEGAEGVALLRAVRAGTAVVVVTSLAAAVAPGALGVVHAGASVVLFATGTGAMLGAYGLGVRRSRREQVDIPGLFLLAGDVAPPGVRRLLRMALAVQAVAVVAAASVRPFTEVAFGILAPMYGLGMMALWAGRHGRFPPRGPRSPA